MKLLAFFVSLAAVLAAGVAQAQYGDMYGYPPVYYGDRATTPIQGIDYGIAAIIRAQGVYNLATSAALINLTEVERREIENRKLWAETYFEMRRINREARAAERGRRPSEADFIRYAQIGKPRRLTPSELDVITGRINWPILLQLPEFNGFRAEVERVFAQRAASGTISAVDYLRVYQVMQMMQAALRQQIRQVPSTDYMIARRFLESLAFESRLPAI
jgi:hypothetical protein